MRTYRIAYLAVAYLASAAHVAATFDPVLFAVRWGLRKSSIPSFVHDLDEAWVEHHLSELERVNATALLCDVDSPLRTSITSRFPEDMYQHLKIPDPTNCQAMQTMMDQIMNCPQALASCEKVSFGQNNRLYDASDVGSVETCYSAYQSVADTLQAMPSLRTLSWFSPRKNMSRANSFKTALSEHPMLLPNLTRLEVDQGMEFLVSMTPAVLDISISFIYEFDMAIYPDAYGADQADFRSTIEALRGIDHLQGLAITHSWQPDMLRDLLDIAPDISHLDIRGGLRDPENGGQPLKTYVPILSQFRNLKQLGLPQPDLLNIGFERPRFMCGNAFFGPNGRKYKRRLARESLAGMYYVSKMLADVASFPRLEKIDFDDNVLTVDMRRRNDDGTLVLPYNGRMKEYSLAAAPRYGPFEGELTTDRYGHPLSEEAAARYIDSDNSPLFDYGDDEDMLRDDWIPEFIGDVQHHDNEWSFHDEL